MRHHHLVARAVVTSAVVALLVGTSPWLAADQAPDRPPTDPAAVLARRQASLQALRDILGTTRVRRRGGRPSAPFFAGFQAPFETLQVGLGVTAYDDNWEDWQARTGELPPDFATMPSQPFIPDPLVMLDSGTRITTKAQWRAQRELIRAGFEKWVFGAMPPAPTNMRAVVTGTSKEGDVVIQDIRLEFGPDHRATLRLQLMIPPGPGPFPVFMTDHPRVRPWVNVGVRRGYISCMYYAADASYLGRDDSAAWQDIYPDYDFSQVARWSWGAMRAVDYLVTLPNVIPNQIAISGHSRNSKQALLAAAFDERIGAVVSSRGNAADEIPFRYNTYPFMAEPMEEMTDGLPYFLNPRLRFFVGHEDKLPVDMNLLQSMVAPRGLLMSHAYTEHQGNALGIEQSYRSAKSVYQFLGQPDRIGLFQLPGEHPASAEDIEVYFDFFDTVFGRAHHSTPEIFIHGYTFDGWRKQSHLTIDPQQFPPRRPGDFMTTATGTPVTREGWPEVRRKLVEDIEWALGEEPPGVQFPNPSRPRGQSWWTSEGYLGQLLPREVQGLSASDLSFGDALKGEYYVPLGRTLSSGRGSGWRGRDRDSSQDQGQGQSQAAPQANGPTPPAPGETWPVVIWLHSEAYGTGYSRYSFWYPLVQQGFGVFTFDQIGFGSRNGSALKFYERFPQWSLMGKMVADTRAAIDAVSALGVTDPKQIYIVGLGMGAQVGLLTAALDDRVAGVATVTGLGSLRSETSATQTEGLRRYSHLHGLLPKLGFFLGNEDRVPVDFDEVLAAIAPRKVLAVAPTLDRYYPVDDVRRLAEVVKPVFNLLGNDKGVEVLTPREFGRFPNSVQKLAYDWMAAVAGRPPLEKTPAGQTSGGGR